MSTTDTDSSPYQSDEGDVLCSFAKSYSSSSSDDPGETGDLENIDRFPRAIITPQERKTILDSLNCIHENDLNIYPAVLKSYLSQKHRGIEDSMQNSLRGGIAFIFPPGMLFKILKTQPERTAPRMVLCDVAAFFSSRPTMLLTFTRDAETGRATDYNSKMSKSLIRFMKMAINEDVSVMHGVIATDHHQEKDVFESRLSDLEDTARLTSFFPSLEMNKDKFKVIIKRFLDLMVTAASLDRDIDTLKPEVAIFGQEKMTGEQTIVDTETALKEHGSLEAWLKGKGLNKNAISIIIDEGFKEDSEILSLDKEDILSLKLTMAQRKLLEKVVLYRDRETTVTPKTNQNLTDDEDPLQEPISLLDTKDLSSGNTQIVVTKDCETPSSEIEAFETWLTENGFTENTKGILIKEEFSKVEELMSLETSDIESLNLQLAQTKRLEKVIMSFPDKMTEGKSITTISLLSGKGYSLGSVDSEESGVFQTKLKEEGFTSDSIRILTEEGFTDVDELLTLSKLEIQSLKLKLAQQKLLERLPLNHGPRTNPKLHTDGSMTEPTTDLANIADMNLRPDPIVSTGPNKDDETYVETEGKDTCLVLVGATGSGKSSLGNTILGKTVFESKTSFQSVTKKLTSAECVRKKQRMKVIDLPGIDDIEMDEASLKEDMKACLSTYPGIDAFLFVIKIGSFKSSGEETFKKFLEYFGDDAKKYAIVVFTHLDSAEDEEIELDELVRGSDKLTRLLSSVKDRYVGVHNRKGSNKNFVKRLQNAIETLMKRNDQKCYTNEQMDVVTETVLSPQ